MYINLNSSVLVIKISPIKIWGFLTLPNINTWWSEQIEDYKETCTKEKVQISLTSPTV